MKRLTTYSFFIFLFCLSSGAFADEMYVESISDDQDYSNSYVEETNDYRDIDSAFREEPYESEVVESTAPPKRRHYSENQDEETIKGYIDLPATIASPGERVIVVDPREHAWGAYSETGRLIRSGLATAGASWCSDLQRPCRTKTGVFRIQSLGDADCYSKKFPLGEGGAPMPYCMYFNGGQGIHGSNAVAAANLSHGCVRVSVTDAEWLRFNFARKNTKVIIKPY